LRANPSPEPLYTSKKSNSDETNSDYCQQSIALKMPRCSKIDKETENALDISVDSGRDVAVYGVVT
jgi:hypothetical protein